MNLNVSEVFAYQHIFLLEIYYFNEIIILQEILYLYNKFDNAPYSKDINALLILTTHSIGTMFSFQ